MDKPDARTGGEAEVNHIPGKPVPPKIMTFMKGDDPTDPNFGRVKKQNSSKLSTTAILVVIALIQLVFGYYMIVREPTPKKPVNVLLIQTDESGEVLRHWEFKDTIVIRSHEGWWFHGESTIFMRELDHYVLLRNPTEKEKQQFLDGKE